MVLIDVASFEIGIILAQILRTIAHAIVTKPSISSELLEFERRFTQLKEDIRSNNISDRDEVILNIQESYRELHAFIISSQNEQ